MNNKNTPTVQEIKANTYSNTTLLIALVISVAVNTCLFVIYHAQKTFFEQRETALNFEIKTLKEKAREEFAKHFIEALRQEDGTILIPKGTRISCPSGDCTNFKIEVPENYYQGN